MLKKSYSKRLLAVLFAAGIIIAGANDLHAQDTLLEDGESYTADSDDIEYDPSDYKKWKENFKEVPVEEAAFLKNKQGCAQKMAFSTILINKARKGEGTDSLTDSKILGDYLDDQYKDIEEKGFLEAQKQIMSDYQECIKDAQVEEDPGKEYDLNMRYGACDKLNTIFLGTIEGIKKRKSIDTTINYYKDRAPDLSETGLGRISDPVVLLISKIYKKSAELDEQGVSEKEKYESLYSYASKMIIMCTM